MHEYNEKQVQPESTQSSKVEQVKHQTKSELIKIEREQEQARMLDLQELNASHADVESILEEDENTDEFDALRDDFAQAA